MRSKDSASAAFPLSEGVRLRAREKTSMARLTKTSSVKEHVWVPSEIKEADLKNLERLGLLEGDFVRARQLCTGDSFPTSGDRLQTVFTAQILVGLSPTPSMFLESVYEYYGVQPFNLKPNAVATLSIFAFLCEAWLGIAPDLTLWRHYYTVAYYPNQGDVWAIGFTLRDKHAYIPVNTRDSWKIFRTKWFKLEFDNSFMDIPNKMNSAVLKTKKQKPKKGYRLIALIARIEELRNLGLTSYHVVQTFIKWRLTPLKNRTTSAFEYRGLHDVSRDVADDISDDVVAERMGYFFGTVAEVKWTANIPRPYCIDNPPPKDAFPEEEGYSDTGCAFPASDLESPYIDREYVVTRIGTDNSSLLSDPNVSRDVRTRGSESERNGNLERYGREVGSVFVSNIAMLDEVDALDSRSLSITERKRKANAVGLEIRRYQDQTRDRTKRRSNANEDAPICGKNSPSLIFGSSAKINSVDEDVYEQVVRCNGNGTYTVSNGLQQRKTIVHEPRWLKKVTDVLEDGKKWCLQAQKRDLRNKLREKMLRKVKNECRKKHGKLIDYARQLTRSTETADRVRRELAMTKAALQEKNTILSELEVRGAEIRERNIILKKEIDILKVEKAALASSVRGFQDNGADLEEALANWASECVAYTLSVIKSHCPDFDSNIILKKYGCANLEECEVLKNEARTTAMEFVKLMKIEVSLSSSGEDV